MREPIGTVLLIESNPDQVQLLQAAIAGGCAGRLEVACSLDDGVQALRRRKLAAVLIGLHVGAGRGLDAIAEVLRTRPELPVVALTASAGDAVEALQHGAHECLDARRCDCETLAAVLEQARERRRRKQMEEQLLRVQKMQVVGQLAGGIAHDFNNLLQAMQSGLEVLRAEITEERRQRAINDLESHIDRGAALTRKLLLFARREIAQRQHLDLNAVIRETLQMLGRLVRENIRVMPSLTEGPLQVAADAGQLEQILVNLAVNASDAMPDGGRLIVGTWQERGMAVCEVTDTGVGMPEEVKARVFDPFFTTKVPCRGAGLGLAMVHGIVKSHEGTITVESSPGFGATFAIHLPAIGHETEAVSYSEESLPTGNQTILFVDDESALVEMGVQMLESLGYHVIGETDPLDALALFREKPNGFDLIVTDMSMPEMTGTQLASDLMDIRPDISVILCTGFNSAITEVQASGMGIKALVMKPIRKSKMANAVRLALQSEQDQGCPNHGSYSRY